MAQSAYQIVEISKGFWRFEENGVRAFLIAGTEKAMLVDTGFGTGDIREVVTSLTDLPLQLVNTHTDRDHIGCNGLFDEAWMHPAEYDRYHQKDGPKLTARPLWEGDEIQLGGRTFEVVLIPGHTPGSIALLDAAHRLLIGGDSVQTGAIFMFGPGRNLPAYIESMKKLDAMRARFDLVYPSHGEVPVSADILPGLIEGAQRLLRGELSGSKPDRPGLEALLYDVGVAKFLYP